MSISDTLHDAVSEIDRYVNDDGPYADEVTDKWIMSTRDSMERVTAMSEPTYLPGTKIRYTMGNLGVGGKPTANVNEGDTGTVIGPAGDGMDGWILTEPDRFPQSVCPVDLDMVEVVR